jgi:hypothetical protein
VWRLRWVPDDGGDDEQRAVVDRSLLVPRREPAPPLQRVRAALCDVPLLVACGIEAARVTRYLSTGVTLAASERVAASAAGGS